MSGVRVVASLTTMPDRYHKIVKTLQSLNKQSRKLDAIYLALPYTCRRIKVDYPEPTDEMKSLCTIVRCTDFGPITKILGGLLSEQDPDTIIITFDDDMIYPHKMVESLLECHKLSPNAAVGSSGMLLRYNCPMCAITPNEDNFLYRFPKFYIPPEGRKVDSIYGYPGALYLRKFFPKVDELEEKFLKYALIDDNTFLNDDITISGYLSLNKIERRIFIDLPVVSFVVDENNTRVRNDNEISYNLDKFFQRMNNAITTVKSVGMYAETESTDLTESIVGRALIVVIAILLLLIIVVYLLAGKPKY